MNFLPIFNSTNPQVETVGTNRYRDCSYKTQSCLLPAKRRRLYRSQRDTTNPPKETNMAENGVTHVSNGTDEQLSMKNTKKENVPKSHQLPQWILVWFLVTAVVCTWDASFIMCRPYSLPGGSLAWIWYFCK